MRGLGSVVLAFWVIFALPQARAATEGTILGTVQDSQGIALPHTKVQLETAAGAPLKTADSSDTGEYQFFPVTFGDYRIVVQASGYSPFSTTVHVSSGSTTQADITLQTPGGGKEIVMKVEAKRRLVNNTVSSSQTEMTHEAIEKQAGGNTISLPRLLETTSAGVVQGPFNQTFIRGNHADVQYQIDGVQLPDSVSGTFAEAFSTRNIDHLEFITGGLPAEYGERLAAVVNISTKTGPETPGGTVELNYGTFNTFNPQLVFGGSNAAGDIHYFISASYNRTDRGIDIPDPKSTAFSDQGTGGDVVHDFSNGNGEFAKIDWLPNNVDKVSFILFQNYQFYQIPNYPSSFSPADPYFWSTYTDAFGNTGGFNYTSPYTNDTQANQDLYGQVVWRHSFSDRSFLQVAPYWKYSKIKVSNDPLNDLFASTLTGTYPNINTPASFALNEHVNNAGVKTDYSVRPDDRNLVKLGVQLQGSQSNDSYQVLNPSATNFGGGDVNRGYFEDVYAQDDFMITKALTLNAGLRYTATQFHFPDTNSSAYQWQPRVGLSYLLTDATKLHAYYGRLFQPAPLEDLREAFVKSGSATSASFYDIKPEKDNYFEFGVDQQVAQTHVMTVNVYYKRATDMLDDTQLLNTSIASPYNFADGYAWGVEYSLKGKVTPDLTDFFNYSYGIAKGQNIDGGTFAVDPASIPRDTYLYLDHVQLHTANAGLTYAKDQYYGTVQGQFGSGLRTGPNNTLSLPSHFAFDLSAGYEFTGDFWSRWKVSGDVFNIFNNAYPISIANGFNGSHYAAGREFFIRLTKML